MFKSREVFLRQGDLESYKELRKEAVSVKPPEQMSEFQKNVFAVFSAVKFDDAKFRAAINKKPKSVLELPQFCAPFDREIVGKLLSLMMADEIASSPQELKILLIAAAFQLFSRIRFSREPMSNADFLMFIQIANRGCDRTVQSVYKFALFVFDLLIENTPPSFEWTDECMGHVIQMVKNKHLDGEFYPLVERFVTRILNLSDKRYWKSVIELVFWLIKEECPVVKGHEIALFNRIEMLDLLLYENDRSAVMLVGACARKLDSDMREHYLEVIGQVYCLAAKMDLKISEPTKVHDLPALYKGAVAREEKSMIESTGNYSFDSFPSQLVVTMDNFINEIPDAMVSANRMIKDFLAMLSLPDQRLFFEKVREFLSGSSKEEKLCILFRHLHLFHIMGSSFLGEKENLNVILDDVMFDPTRTAFGPETLDEKINEYRAAVVDVFAHHVPNCLETLCQRQQGKCFLLAELAARFCLYYDFDFSVLGTNNTVRLFSDTLVALRNMGSDFAPRMAIFRLFFHYLQCKVNGRVLLSEGHFVNSFLRFLYEKGMTDAILQALNDSFANMTYSDLVSSQSKQNTESLHVLNETTNYLLTFIDRAPEMFVKVASFVTETVTLNPELCVEFLPFLDMFMKQLKHKNDPAEFHNAVTLLSAISTATPSFELSMEYLQILSQVITSEHFTLLLNLAGGSSSVSSNKINYFLIRRPSFLPLLFVAFGKDINQMNDFLEYLKKLVIDRCDYNVFKLHEGGVDSILLKWLQSGPKITHRGIVIEFQARKQLVLEVLALITSTTSDFSIARKFTNAIYSKPTDTDLIQCLSNLVVKANNRFTTTYSIGTLPEFGAIDDLNGNDMNGSFIFSFWLRNDQSILAGSTAFSHIVSLRDTKGCVFSLSMINNTPYAIFEDDKKTLVSLCQRMTSNKWTHFLVVFRNREDGSISTLKDGEPLHDSEFRPIRMAPGKLKVTFGGYTYDHRLHRYEGMVAGKIAKLSMFKRMLTMEEIEGIFLRDDVPNDCLFYLSAPRHVRRNSKDIPLHSNAYTGVSIANAIVQSPTNIRRLFLAFCQTSDPMLLSILSKVITKSKDKSLVAEVATMLLNMKRDYRLYLMLFKLVRGIKDQNTKFVWFQDVLINVDMWDVQDSRIVSHWTSLLTLSDFAPFFNNPGTFPHFNPFLYFLLRIEDPTPEAILLMKRVGRMGANGFNDTNALLYVLFRNKDNAKRVCIYLSILRDVADKIVQTHATKCLALLQLVEYDDTAVVAGAIETLAAIFDDKFFALIPTILEKVKVSEELLSKLVTATSSFPAIFALLCAIRLINEEASITPVPEGALLKPRWYVYPTILYAKSEEPLRTELANYLVRNSIAAPEHMQKIIFLLINITKFAQHAEFDPCRDLLAHLGSAVGGKSEKRSSL